jgi:hypothetical protein
LADQIAGDAVSWFLLLVGQVIVALSCCTMPFAILALGDKVKGTDAGIVILVGGVLSFGLNAALFIVFGRARSLARLAQEQAKENDRLWGAIHSLQNANRSPGDNLDRKVSSLVAHLKDEVPAVRRAAAEALGQIGPEAKAAVPALRDALRDEDGGVRRLAAAALEKIDPEAAPESGVP